ncbi:MAG: hypothetical protein EOM65_11815 [Synergistales bacterium]|nr:hypothetical protein [Synergistales bacterium]
MIWDDKAADLDAEVDAFNRKHPSGKISWKRISSGGEYFLGLYMYGSAFSTAMSATEAILRIRAVDNYLDYVNDEKARLKAQKNGTKIENR